MDNPEKLANKRQRIPKGQSNMDNPEKLATQTKKNTTQVTFIEQKGECIIRYFGRPCDEFAERVWPIKIYDGARVTLFNKELVSCDVNQS